jgi:hypothetical protein
VEKGSTFISTSKNAMSFLLLLISSLQLNWRKEQNMFCLEVSREGDRGWWWGKGEEMTQTIYAHLNK